MPNFCYNCGSEVVWQNDFTFEDYGVDEEGIVSIQHCPNCDSDIEVWTTLSEEEPADEQEEDKETERKEDNDK